MKLNLLFEADEKLRMLQRAAASGDIDALEKLSNWERRTDELLGYWRDWPDYAKSHRPMMLDGLNYAMSIDQEKMPELLFQIAKGAYNRIDKELPRNIGLLFRKWMNHIRRSEVFEMDGQDRHYIYQVLNAQRDNLSMSPKWYYKANHIYELFSYLQSPFHPDLGQSGVMSFNEQLYAVALEITLYYPSGWWNKLWDTVLKVYPNYGDKENFRVLLAKWKGPWTKSKPQISDTNKSDLDELL